jgi:hypothetical protein
MVRISLPQLFIGINTDLLIIVETDGVDVARHPFRSLIIGGPGPFINFRSHSFLSYLGPQVYILLLDCRYVVLVEDYNLALSKYVITRAERKKSQVCSDLEYKVVFDRLARLPQEVEHLIIQIG